MASPDLKSLETHYEFGANWASFANTIDEQSIRYAEEGVLKLLTRDELRDQSFLDIGCGSGIHSLAASRLGIGRLLSTDIDPKCIATTKALVARHGISAQHEAKEISVFDVSPEVYGTWDIVYSWGVLHHTGAMHEAIRRASAMVRPGGLFSFALYRRTTLVMDKFWTAEKRWYTSASPVARQRADAVFKLLMRFGFFVSRRNYADYVKAYKGVRGADHSHDVSDWMGGYPYEVISPQEVDAVMQKLGFVHIRSFVNSGIGIFGSGCDEFTYRRETGTQSE